MLVATVFLYEWLPVDIGVTTVSLTKLLGVITGVAVLLAALYNTTRTQRLRVPARALVILALLVGFDILGTVSGLRAGGQATDFAFQQVGAILWVTLALLILTSAPRIDAIMPAYCTAAVGVHIGIILDGFGIASFHASLESQQRVLITPLVSGATRSAGFLVNFGEVAIITAFALPWLVMIALGTRRRITHRMLAAAAIAACAVGSIVSLSRNVWVASAASLLLLLVGGLTTGSRRLYRWAVFSFMIALAVASFPFLWGWAKTIVASAASLRKISIDTRVEQYALALQRIASSGIVGSGPGMLIQGLPVHNLFLNAFLAAGIGGAFLVAAILTVLLGIWRRATRQHDLQLATIGSGFTGVLVATMFYPVIGNSAPIFWLTFGIAASAWVVSSDTMRLHEVDDRSSRVHRETAD
ncbi:MAG TPA: hypothetical protein VFT41_12915 [Gemmatimonadaceae bacterium]|nr:hypothetical protein [Gemmatimonadaceae bacterium]